jgi:hypothetical protein
MNAIVELPAELKALLAVLITVVVTECLKWIGSKLNADLSGYAAQVTAAIVGSILVLVNAVFSNIPAEAAPIVNQVFVLIVIVLGSFGAYKVFLAKAKG